MVKQDRPGRIPARSDMGEPVPTAFLGGGSVPVGAEAWVITQGPHPLTETHNLWLVLFLLAPHFSLSWLLSRPAR